jgi:hypothetical protein
MWLHSFESIIPKSTTYKVKMVWCKYSEIFTEILLYVTHLFNKHNSPHIIYQQQHTYYIERFCHIVLVLLPIQSTCKYITADDCEFRLIAENFKG